jgi:hypothetical protein
MEAELRSYADVVAHDLSEPIAGIELLVRLLRGAPRSRRRPTCCASYGGAPSGRGT